MRRPGLLARLLGVREGAGAWGADHDDGPVESALPVPPGVSVQRDLPYGDAPAQCLDVYRPSGATHGGLMVLVHGGGWRRGDKSDGRLIGHKLAHWAKQGWTVASINYRLVPEADPLEQADDVARALSWLQGRCGQWGIDPARIVLMGHSAGAHLVAVLTADTSLAGRHGLVPWLATVAIDTAAYDLVALMEAPHFALYDLAFGVDPQAWRRASPLHCLQAPPVMPWLLVCSARRPRACGPAQALAARVRALGGRASVLPVALGHLEINRQLGLDAAYTSAVDAFIASA
jgi:acetyl esterase/lipase